MGPIEDTAGGVHRLGMTSRTLDYQWDDTYKSNAAKCPCTSITEDLVPSPGLEFKAQRIVA